MNFGNEDINTELLKSSKIEINETVKEEISEIIIPDISKNIKNEPLDEITENEELVEDPLNIELNITNKEIPNFQYGAHCSRILLQTKPCSSGCR